MNLFSNNPDFYPTPTHVIEKMMMSEDFIGKTVLEPSAGSGNIVKWLKQNGAREVIACENDPHCRKLLAGQCSLIADDFLTVTPDMVSHVDYIVMNPPFSRGADHILHAWEIAPAGCTVIALCNTSNLRNEYYNTKHLKLSETVQLNGSSEDLGSVFDRAERRTNVKVSLVKLYKQGSGDNEFDGYFFSAVDEDTASGKDGLVSYNFVRDIVGRYVQAVKLFDSVMLAAKQINEAADFFDYTTVIDEKTGEEKQVKNTYGNLPVTFGAILCKNDEDVHGDNGTKITHEQYKKYLQKHYWRIIFKKLHMEKYATAQLRENINKFIEQQTHIPFTMANIYRVLEIVVKTNSQRMLKALEEAFNTICSLSAENSTAGEKWKTNANYMVNKRFICNWITTVGTWYGKMEVREWSSYNDNATKINDVCKALCYMTGRNWEEIGTLGEYVRKNEPEWGKWFEWGFFRCRGYKKGTMHFEFLDDDVWFKFNYEVSKLKGWSLPKKTQTERKPRTKKQASTEVTLF